MSSKKTILESVLLKELIAIRTDTLWRMLFLFKYGQLPDINEEGATGKLDNKGAIFIPGGLIYQDVDEKQISYEPSGNLLTGEMKRKKIDYGKEHIFAEFDNITVLGVLRTYKPTNPGKRSLKYRLDLVSHEKDVDIDLDRIAGRAHERYKI